VPAPILACGVLAPILACGILCWGWLPWRCRGAGLARVVRFLRIAQDGAFPAECGTALFRGYGAPSPGFNLDQPI